MNPVMKKIREAIGLYYDAETPVEVAEKIWESLSDSDKIETGHILLPRYVEDIWRGIRTQNVTNNDVTNSDDQKESESDRQKRITIGKQKKAIRSVAKRKDHKIRESISLRASLYDHYKLSTGWTTLGACTPDQADELAVDYEGRAESNSKRAKFIRALAVRARVEGVSTLTLISDEGLRAVHAEISEAA